MCDAPKPRGLVNLGNTCYFNSIAQVLLNAPLFGPMLIDRTSSQENKYLLEDPDSEEQIELELPECDYSVKALVELCKSYKGLSANGNSTYQPISPNKLLSCIRQKTGRFQRLLQEDSHELLRSLIDMVRSDEIRRQKAAITSHLGNSRSDIKANCFTIIDIVFGGYFLSSVICRKCKFNSQHLEPFFDLSLAITDPIDDIRSAIASFTANAILDGENKFICERCTKANGKKTYEAGIKSTKIAVPPNILTLHLKRFEASTGESHGLLGLGGGRKGKRHNKNDQNGSGSRRRGKMRGDSDDGDDGFVCARGGLSFRKINKHIEFTEFLDLSGFCCDLCYDLTKINGWPRIRKGEPIWYSLFGAVCHSGNLRGGHYTAFVKCEESDTAIDEFSAFIQEMPYLPDLADIDKIKERIRQHDLERSETTSRYREEDNESCNGDKPRSVPGNWYHISDSDVRKSSLANVLSSQAYILFYRRLE